MWFLTCDGDLLGSKRVWLRPGSEHILGRTTERPDGTERQLHISNRSVSRKHLKIDIDEVKAGNSSQIYARSNVRLTDNSTMGTSLNQTLFKKETRTLDSKTNVIKLGNYEHLFHITWQPIVLSFPAKKSTDYLERRRKDLEQSDIKVVADYVVNQSTHFVAKKRNVISALVALVDESWVVTDAFVSELVKAATRPHDGAEIPLEADFEANWPKELDFIVPSGAEPHPRPDSFFKPDPRRREVFQDFIFVFVSETQYDDLLPIITTGGGKALLNEVDPVESNVPAVVEYVRGVAGKKDSGHFRLSQQTGPGGVVVVRIQGHDRAGFVSAIDRALDQRSIEQNEFLDAILMVDASGLRQPLRAEEEPVADIRAPQPPREPVVRREEPQRQQRAITVEETPAAEEQGRSTRVSNEREDEIEPAPEQQAPEEAPEPPRKRTRRVITQSRFRGFDDFDPSQFTRPASASPEPSQVDPSQQSNRGSMDVDEPSQAPNVTQKSRKRPAPTEAEEQEDMYAKILTGYTSMKRQRTEAAPLDDHSGPASKSPVEANGSTTAVAKGSKKKSKEMDVIAEVQALRKQQEEQRRADEEALRQKLPEGTTIEDLKNLAIVEEMEVPVRERPARNTRRNGEGDGWDPAWNGRKNFKKFRRQGENQNVPRLQRVMIPLEEVPRKGHGIGEEYWLNSSSTNKSKSNSQSQSQNIRAGASRTQRGNDDEDGGEDASQFRRRRIMDKARQDAEDDAARDEISPEEIAGQPRDHNIQAALDATPTQTLATHSQREAAGKRPATQQAGGPAKKARQTRPVSSRAKDDDDDDDDGLRFRRR